MLRSLKYIAAPIVVAAIAIQMIVQYESNHWKMPPAVGKLAIVTGANTGLGMETARRLALGGADVVMACRNASKCSSAAEKIQAQVMSSGGVSSSVTTASLDLSELSSVIEFAQRFKRTHSKLDLLINNAAIMATPYGINSRGTELQFATNHLGAFALTGLLQPLLKSTAGSRVVNHASSANMFCDTLYADAYHNVTRDQYDPSRSYGCSKRANLYFTWALKQRGFFAISAHPGWTGTDLQHRATGYGQVVAMVLNGMNHLFSQSIWLGAQPQLYGATESNLQGGELVGPRFFMVGSPVIETTEHCDMTSTSGNQCKQQHLDALWSLSEQLTNVKY